MTRIVKAGLIPPPPTHWQTKVLFQCRRCGCEWYADDGDWHAIDPRYLRYNNEAGCAGMDCPTCAMPCQIREPGKPIARGL